MEVNFFTAKDPISISFFVCIGDNKQPRQLKKNESHADVEVFFK